MSAIDQVIKPSSKTPCPAPPKPKARPHDPSQIVDLYPRPPSLPSPSRTIPQRLLSACCFFDIRKPGAVDPGNKRSNLPRTRPLRLLEPRPVSTNDGCGPGLYPSGARAAQVHSRPEWLEEESRLDEYKLSPGAKGKGRADEGEREVEDWDREAWERAPAEQEKRRAVQREKQRQPRKPAEEQPTDMVRTCKLIVDAENREEGETYADLDNISVLEASSTHTESRRPRSHTPYPMGKIVKTPHASRGTSVAMSRVDQSNHPLPPRILEGVTYTRSRQIIRKNGIIATSVGCGRSACVITPTTSAVNLSQDLKRSGRKEPKKTGEEERGGSGHCGDGKGHDIYGDGGDLPPTTEQSPVHCEKPPILKLRGGGGSVNEDGKDTKLKRLEDDERVPALIWYFAGNKGPPPTGKQLRDRREKEKAYIERKQAGADARKEERQAKWKGRKAAVPGSFWKNPFRRKKKRVKLRADEEGKDKEVVDEPEPAPGASEAENAAE